MIKRNELNSKGYPETQEQQLNLDVLCERLNMIRANWGKPMIVTSGLRSSEDQARINPAAMHSKHLTGEAADILDTDGSLKAWVLSNVHLLELAQLWCEDFAHTPNWCHFQIVPPKSGHRFFIP